MAETPVEQLAYRLRLHAYDLVNGGANASQLRDDLNTAAALLASRSPQQDGKRQWTLDNIYTIARRERPRQGGRTFEMWGHVIRLCEAVGCQPRGVLRDNGGPLPDPPSVAPRQERMQEQEKEQDLTRIGHPDAAPTVAVPHPPPESQS